MIRCKLISPTNLMLEHPLLLAPHDESEFFVIGRKEHERVRRRLVFGGALLGFAAAVFLTGVFSAVAAVLR